MGSLSLLQGIFPTQGSSPGLPHCEWILYHPSYHGRPRILEWVASPFSRGIFLTQELNRGLLRCRRMLCQLSHQGNPVQSLVPSFKSTEAFQTRILGIGGLPQVREHELIFHFINSPSPTTHTHTHTTELCFSLPRADFFLLRSWHHLVAHSSTTTYTGDDIYCS